MIFMPNSLQPPASTRIASTRIAETAQGRQPFDLPPGWPRAKRGFEFGIAGYSKSDFTLLINVG